MRHQVERVRKACDMDPNATVYYELVADALRAAADVLARGIADGPHHEATPIVTGAMPTKLLMSVDEAAECLSIGRAKAYELVAAGTIPSVKLGRRRLVPVEALRAQVATWSREEGNG